MLEGEPHYQRSARGLLREIYRCKSDAVHQVVADHLSIYDPNNPHLAMAVSEAWELSRSVKPRNPNAIHLKSVANTVLTELVIGGLPVFEQASANFQESRRALEFSKKYRNVANLVRVFNRDINQQNSIWEEIKPLDLEENERLIQEKGIEAGFRLETLRNLLEQEKAFQNTASQDFIRQRLNRQRHIDNKDPRIQGSEDLQESEHMAQANLVKMAPERVPVIIGIKDSIDYLVTLHPNVIASLVTGQSEDNLSSKLLVEKCVAQIRELRSHVERFETFTGYQDPGFRAWVYQYFPKIEADYIFKQTLEEHSQLFDLIGSQVLSKDELLYVPSPLSKALRKTINQTGAVLILGERLT